MAIFPVDGRVRKPVDQLRPGLLQVILHRLRSLNDNTRQLLRLLDADWGEIRTRAVRHLRDRMTR